MLTKDSAQGPVMRQGLQRASGILRTSVMFGGGGRLALKVGFCKRAAEVRSLTEGKCAGGVGNIVSFFHPRLFSAVKVEIDVNSPSAYQVFN